MSNGDGAEELPQLTPKQTAFVNALLGGKSASDAYREGYNCESMSQGTVWVEASRLRRSPKISLWLRHYQRIGLEAGLVTMEAHIAELARGRELALALGQIAAAVQAEHCRGKAVGLYEDRLSASANISDEDLVKAIENLLGREIARSHQRQIGRL